MNISTLAKKYSVPNSKVRLQMESIETPLGTMVAVADDSFLHLLLFKDSKNLEKKLLFFGKELACEFVENSKNKVFIQLKKELAEYFDGKLKKFEVPVKTFGSDYHKEIWKKLQQTEYGTTKSYGDHALSMGKPTNHARAIGAACGANNHIIVIPCHRLVSTGGKGGFSAGIDRKDWLVNHEAKHKNSVETKNKQEDEAKKEDKSDIVNDETKKEDKSDIVNDETKKEDKSEIVSDEAKKEDESEIVSDEAKKGDKSDIVNDEAKKEGKSEIVSDETEKEDKSKIGSDEDEKEDEAKKVDEANILEKHEPVSKKKKTA